MAFCALFLFPFFFFFFFSGFLFRLILWDLSSPLTFAPTAQNVNASWAIMFFAMGLIVFGILGILGPILLLLLSSLHSLPLLLVLFLVL